MGIIELARKGKKKKSNKIWIEVAIIEWNNGE